ncbi:MmgE/PrpD family protein [Roseobacteraceae bacterium NS-SX3]
MDQTPPDPLRFALTLTWEDIPPGVRAQAKLSLLDTLGVGADGLGTALSRIIRGHAHESFGGGLPMLFDGRGVSAPGFALAAGMTIDALDGHDGYNPAKGHIGAPLIPGLLALARTGGASGRDLLTALVAGYEFGARAAVAQHATACDYHTSGSWGAVAVAAAGARLLDLSAEQARHAAGIAEYHGPRSQMMRCIAHPAMVKDGAGWGAMAGVSAVQLARRGFSGAPAVIAEEAPEHWQDLGRNWRMLEQYYKPYPVCRWAQAPVEGVLALKARHGITSAQVERIETATFRESVALAARTPRTTEEAQYSTSFPCAVALVHGTVRPADLEGPALADPEVLRLSQGMVLRESAFAGKHFPARRFARTRLILKDGRRLEGDWMEPRWDPSAPPTAGDLRAKFRLLAEPVLGAARAAAIEAAVLALEEESFDALWTLLTQPVS